MVCSSLIAVNVERFRDGKWAFGLFRVKMSFHVPELSSEWMQLFDSSSNFLIYGVVVVDHVPRVGGFCRADNTIDDALVVAIYHDVGIGVVDNRVL